jgi:endonuclease III
MRNAATYAKATTTGFPQQQTKYQAINCSHCPLNGVCHKSKGNRVV